MQSKKLVNGYPFISYSQVHLNEDEMLTRSKEFLTLMSSRRSIRDFSDRPVAKEVIENIVLTASSAPSGANKQPWTFCIVADPALKKIIRRDAEKEEYESYNGRMPEEWKNDLLPLQTDWNKSFLETAPYLIVLFKKSYGIEADGNKSNTYYASESCGIAAGILLAAIHHAGLVALTHTPSPMNFLGNILDRPVNEKPYLLIPVGYPAEECWVPDIYRKTASEVIKYY